MTGHQPEVYLDHAATTVVRDSVIDEMSRVMRETGNASSLHAAGRRARREVEQAREEIAEAVGAHPVEVIFTGGATEADNLAVKGGYWARHDAEPACSAVAVSPAEHPAVLDAARWLARHEGAELRWIEVDRTGAARRDALAEAIGAGGLAIAAAMWVNNEVGTFSDVAELAALCTEHAVPFHVDAVQALGRVAIDFAGLGVSSMALSAHKVGGPQGVGVLLAARTFSLVPTSHGGGQERQVRSGTLDVAGAVGMAVAVRAAEQERMQEAARLSALRERIVGNALLIEGVEVNGVTGAGGSAHPGIANLYLPGADADAVLMLLDGDGIDVSTGSACTAGVAEPSHVVLAMTGDHRRATQSIRISMGRTTTPDEVERLLAALPDVVRRARQATGYPAARG